MAQSPVLLQRLSGEIGRLADDVERLQDVLGDSGVRLGMAAQCLDELTQRARALANLSTHLANPNSSEQPVPVAALIPLGDLVRRLQGERGDGRDGDLELF